MPARLDPFIDLLLKNGGEQLTLIPDEPVGLDKDGKSTKLSKQALSERQVYALLTEIAPSECADLINQGAPTAFEYAADRGLVQVKVTPNNGRLVASIVPDGGASAPARPAAPPPAAAAPRRPS